MDGSNVTFDEDLAWRGYSFRDDDGTKFCEEQPTFVYSFGIWEKLSQYHPGMLIWDYTLPNLEVTIFLVLCLWQFFYFLLKKIHLPVPKITSMMLAGAALSQTSLLPNDWLVQHIFFPDDFRPKVPETIGAFAFVFYWFLEGIKMDVGMIKRTGKKAVVTGIATVVLPIFTANLVFDKLKRDRGKKLDWS